MALTDLNVAEEALSLSPADRVELAKFLIRSLEGDPRTDDEIKVELNRRLQDFAYRKRSGFEFRSSVWQALVKAVFSSRFKTDLLEAEKRYAEISPRLGAALRERIAGQVREIIRWNGGDHIGPHVFPAGAQSLFRSTSSTRSRAKPFTSSRVFASGGIPRSSRARKSADA